MAAARGRRLELVEEREVGRALRAAPELSLNPRSCRAACPVEPPPHARITRIASTPGTGLATTSVLRLEQIPAPATNPFQSGTSPRGSKKPTVTSTRSGASSLSAVERLLEMLRRC